MNIKVCKTTLQKRISEHSPVFHDFMKGHNLYRGLTDAIIVDRDDTGEPAIITSHSEIAPFEYYEWVKRGSTYYPRPISQIRLNSILLTGYRSKA